MFLKKSSVVENIGENGMFRIATFVLLFSCSLAAYSATWYAFTSANTESTRFFFDRDSVIKSGDKVTVWTKTVNDVKSLNLDQRYSTAARRSYSCNKKTVQTLAFINYGKGGNIIFSSSKPSDATEIIPDSVDEEIIKAVCSHNFPKDKKSQLYYPVKGNDIFTATQNYYSELEMSKVDAAPPQPTWYVLPNASSDEHQYFVDTKSTSKTDDEVSAWVLSISDPNVAKNDGVYSSGYRAQYSCKNGTAKYMVFSDYDKVGKFLRTLHVDSEEVVIKGGTIAGEILRVVCSNDFPKIEGTDLYFPVNNNDPYAYAKIKFDVMKSNKK